MARLDGAADELDQRGDDVVVERSRVDLTDAGEHLVEAEVAGDALLEIGELGLVTTEQVELVLRGADRTLDATQRVARDQVVEPFHRDQQLVGDRGEALAERGGLGGDVVAAAGHDELGVLTGEAPEPGEGGNTAIADKLERGADLQLLDVLGEVTRGHALVDVLGAGECSELLDAGLHVVAGDLLAVGDRLEVDLVDDGLVRLDDAVGRLDTEILLGHEDGDPQSALEDDLVLRRPDARQLRRCVSAGQNVGGGHPSIVPSAAVESDIRTGMCAVEADLGHAGVRALACLG